MNAYDVGDRVRLSVVFTNDAGAVADPTTVACSVKPRFGAATTYTYAGSTITKTGTGAYYVDIDATAQGLWDYRFVGTGAVVAAAAGSFNVRTSQF